MSITLKDYPNRFSKTPRLYTLLISALLFIGVSVVSLLIPVVEWLKYIVPLWYILTLTFDDVLRFQTTITWNEQFPISFEHKCDMMVACRISQAEVQILLLAIIYVLFGWEICLASELWHWFGVEEILYYWTTKTELSPTWDWLKWTPFGIVKGNLNNDEVVTQSIIGMVLSIVVLFVVSVTKRKIK